MRIDGNETSKRDRILHNPTVLEVNAVPPSCAVASRFVKCLAVVGAVCSFGPLVSFVFTAYTMVRQFEAGMEGGAVVDNDRIRDDVKNAFAVAGIGLSLGLVGILLGCVVIFGFRFAPNWLRGALTVAAVSLLPVFPIGTVLALVLLIVLRRRQQTSTRATTI